MSALLGLLADLVGRVVSAVAGLLLSRLRGPVTVSPARIRLTAGEWVPKTVFKIRNRGDRPIYSIYVKVTVERSTMVAGDLDVEPLSPKHHVEGRMGSIAVSAECYEVVCIDEAGREALLVVVHSLDPAETKTFSLARRAASPVPASRPVVRLKAVNWAAVPALLLEKPDQVAASFVPPDNLKIKEIRLLMRRVV
jgi:hypothetical protein